MSVLRATWRLVRTLAHAALGALVVHAAFGRLRAAHRHACIGRWSRGLLRALGVRLAAAGEVAPGARLVVANHVSWLDVMALHALAPHARFVAMAELRSWPAVAPLADAAGTIYLQRRRPRDLWRVVREATAALRAGETVVVFPEGVVSDGTAPPGRFHANLLQAAIDAAVPVQAVALRYADARHAASRAVDFTGGVSLGQSLWRTAGARDLVLHLRVLPPVLAEPGEHRRALAARLHAAVTQAYVTPAAPAVAAECPNGPRLAPAVR
ncbi:MAG: 1-acyl-sn-glycerol-3-phosphate acyltransferase [Rubrivivax sp.]|nr:1-acyl-sn-glycerol-3-phosphate acyltransferase [Rubrivivax sp.]